MTVVPSPARLSMANWPPCASTMRSTMASPRPVPLGRVVKNGSRARERTCVSIPSPVSMMSTATPPTPVLRVAPHPHGERAPAAHRLHGVVDEVVEDLPEEVRVAPHAFAPERVAQQLHLDAPLLGLGEGERALEEVGEHELRPLDVHRARVAEEIRHQAVQAVGLLVEDGEERDVVLPRDGLLAEARHRVGDDGQRVPHLVRDDRRELAHHRQLLLLDELLLRGAKLLVRAAELVGSRPELGGAAVELRRDGRVSRADRRGHPQHEGEETSVDEPGRRDRSSVAMARSLIDAAVSTVAPMTTASASRRPSR